MDQGVGPSLLTTRGHVRSQSFPYGNCDLKSSFGTSFSPTASFLH